MTSQDRILGHWPEGEAEVEALLAEGELERVQASDELSERRFSQADESLEAARLVLDISPRTAYVNAYDAARLALAAVLDKQGLRATSKGGHLAIQHCLRAQLGSVARVVIPAFADLRRGRNTAEYGQLQDPEITRSGAKDAIDDAADIIAKMKTFSRNVGRF